MEDKLVFLLVVDLVVELVLLLDDLSGKELVQMLAVV